MQLRSVFADPVCFVLGLGRRAFLPDFGFVEFLGGSILAVRLQVGPMFG